MPAEPTLASSPKHLPHLSVPSQGLAEGPGNPGGPVALGPGSQGDLVAPSRRASCMWREVLRWALGQFDLILAWWDMLVMAASKQLVYITYSLYSLWLECCWHMNKLRLLTLTDTINQSLSFHLDAIMCVLVPRIMCFRATFSMVFALLFPCGKKNLKPAQRVKEMSAVNGLIGLVNTSTSTAIWVIKKSSTVVLFSDCLTALPEPSVPLSQSPCVPKSGLWRDTWDGEQ